jgi:hypothetical protein
MSEDKAKPLTLVTDFSKANYKGQYGWQKIDETTVLERKKLPILVYSNSEADRWGVIVDVYNFNSFERLTYVQHAYDSEAKTPSVLSKGFSAIENKQCIFDAHRALRQLGGSPLPLEQLIEMLGCESLDKPRAAPRLKSNEI